MTSQMQDRGMGLLYYNGLYCHIYPPDPLHSSLLFNQILRFYPDGTVISATIAQEEDGPEPSYFPKGDWFNREDERYRDLLGRYKITGDSIAFTTFNERGSVDYHGTIQEDCLVLDSRSNINGHEDTFVKYIFYLFEEIPGQGPDRG